MLKRCHVKQNKQLVTPTCAFVANKVFECIFDDWFKRLLFV